MKYRGHDAQRDANEPGIVDTLLAVGASVRRSNDGDGFPDLVVGFRGVNYLIEVKLPLGPRGGEAHSKLNDDQAEFFRGWRGQRAIARHPREALDIIGATAGG